MSRETMAPTQLLVLEVLAARYRLGERIWPFNTRCRPAVRALADKGLVGWKGGIVEDTVLAWLTDEGRKGVLDDSYVPPILRDERSDEIRRLQKRLRELEETP